MRCDTVPLSVVAPKVMQADITEVVRCDTVSLSVVAPEVMQADITEDLNLHRLSCL